MSSQAIELVLRRDRAVIVAALVVITGLAWASQATHLSCQAETPVYGEQATSVTVHFSDSARSVT
jgi:predicted metal-binding membrane protein